MKALLRNTFYLALAVVFTMTSCKKKNDPEPEPEPNPQTPEFAILSSAQGNFDGLVNYASDLSSGSIDITAAEENLLTLGNMDIIDGKLYESVNGEAKFKQYSLESGKLVEMASVPLNSTAVHTFSKLNDNQLIVTVNGYYSDGNVPYLLLNTNPLAVASTGTLSVPVLPNSLIWVNSLIIRDDKLFVAYIHCDDVNYANYDTAYVSVYNASTLAYEKTIKDTRTACLGYDNHSDYYIDNNGDLYISSSNSDYWGVNEKLPAGILRIKAAETEFDPTYFFNVTARIDNKHFVGMMPVGNNKFIVQAFDKSLITQYDDYNNGFSINHYVIDIAGQSAAKLDLPVHKGAINGLVKPLGNNTYVMPINSKDGNFFYTYNSTDNTVKKGAQVVGSDRIWNLIPLK